MVKVPALATSIEHIDKLGLWVNNLFYSCRYLNNFVLVNHNFFFKNTTKFLNMEEEDELILISCGIITACMFEIPEENESDVKKRKLWMHPWRHSRESKVQPMY